MSKCGITNALVGTTKRWIEITPMSVQPVNTAPRCAQVEARELEDVETDETLQMNGMEQASSITASTNNSFPDKDLFLQFSANYKKPIALTVNNGLQTPRMINGIELLGKAGIPSELDAHLLAYFNIQGQEQWNSSPVTSQIVQTNTNNVTSRTYQVGSCDPAT